MGTLLCVEVEREAGRGSNSLIRFDLMDRFRMVLGFWRLWLGGAEGRRFFFCRCGQKKPQRETLARCGGALLHGNTLLRRRCRADYMDTSLVCWVALVMAVVD